ncbi:MAG: hypothetical protein Q4C58_15610, partial [Eubacteriales bacterium]|nr:hypothetical protein [Eubacteriales bacterium]
FFRIFRVALLFICQGSVFWKGFFPSVLSWLLSAATCYILARRFVTVKHFFYFLSLLLKEVSRDIFRGGS